MDKQIFQVPAGVSSVKTMSKQLRITFDTMDQLTGEQLSTVFSWIDQIGHLTFAISQVEPEDIVGLPQVRPMDKKSPSQRLHSVLFVLWQQQYSDQYKDFDDFYKNTMERFINQCKEKLS